MAKFRNKDRSKADKRKAAMEAKYAEYFNKGLDRVLIISKIAEDFFLAEQTIRDIIKPRTIRKRLGLKKPNNIQ